jgi:hypothetical protein
VRSFDLRTQVQFAGSTAIPEGQLLKANGELIYENEVDETIYADAAPEGVPMDVWQQAVQMVKNAASTGRDKSGPSGSARAGSQPTLQVLELIRIPFTEVGYGYGNSDYTLYIYDGPGSEKFYAERYPARWDRIERLVRSITSDLMASSDESAQSNNASSQARGYRVPVEKPPYTITEVDSEDTTENRWNPNAQSIGLRTSLVITDVRETMEKGLEIGGIARTKRHDTKIAHVLFGKGIIFFVCMLRIEVDLMLADDEITLHECL